MSIRIPIAATLAAVMAVSSLGISTALAAPSYAKPAVTSAAQLSDAPVINVAAKKRHYRRRNDAAAAAAFMGIMGGMMALSAQDSYRDRYYDDGGYYYGNRRRTYYGGGGGGHGRPFRGGGGGYTPGYSDPAANPPFNQGPSMNR